MCLYFFRHESSLDVSFNIFNVTFNGFQQILKWDFWNNFQIGDEITTKLKSGERLKTENVELMTQIKLLQLDKRRLDEEVDRASLEILYV